MDRIDIADEESQAFSALRDAITIWKAFNPKLSVAIGGDSDSGEWSIVRDEGGWSVFVGERGQRFSVAHFLVVWDAVSYLGFRATEGLEPQQPFPVLRPKLDLA